MRHTDGSSATGAWWAGRVAAWLGALNWALVSAPASATVSAYDARYLAPLNESRYNLVRKGRVIPVKVAVGCGGVPLTGLSPAIQILSGDRSDAGESSSDNVETLSSSAADTTGVMRAGGEGYIYNLRVPDNAAAGQLFTIRVRPFGDANPGASMYVVLQIRR